MNINNITETIRQNEESPCSDNNSNGTVDERYLNIALEAGRIALGSNAESARSDEIMKNILASSGCTDYSTSVIATSIFARLGDRTLFKIIKSRNTNLYKICAVNQVSRDLKSGKISAAEAEDQLRKADHTKIYRFPIRLFAYIFVMAAMPVLFNGSLVDCISAAGCGLIMGILSAVFLRIRIHSFANVIIQSFIMIMCGLLAAVLSKGKIDMDIIMAAAITPLFPGLALTNAVRDTLQGYYASGSVRLMEAVMKAFGIAFGVAIGVAVTFFIAGSFDQEITASILPSLTDNGAKYLIYAIAALLYSAGYCFLFEVPSRFIIWGAVVGCIGKLISLFSISQGVSRSVSAFAATVVIAILAQIFARIFKTPTITFLIAGIMAQVPGRALYNSILTLMTGEYAEGIKSLLETLTVAIAISIAIFLVDTVFLTATRIKRKELLEQDSFLS